MVERPPKPAPVQRLSHCSEARDRLPPLAKESLDRPWSEAKLRNTDKRDALGRSAMIRDCTDADVAAIETVVNDAAQIYRDVIPADCWHEPYMSRSDLLAEIDAGVAFSGWEDANTIVGVMGLQQVRDVTLIRHAYVRPTYQARGIGSALLTTLAGRIKGPLLVGTWAAAEWAIRFYVRHGFQQVSVLRKERLLKSYWRVPLRQRESSVVLTRHMSADS